MCFSRYTSVNTRWLAHVFAPTTVVMICDICFRCGTSVVCPELYTYVVDGKHADM